MKKLNELFEVTYGNKFDFNKMSPLSVSNGGVNFVGRSSQNHGVSGTVKLLDNIAPYESGLITVSLGGSKLLSSFIQDGPFYTAQNVAVLKPKQPMTFSEKLFVCVCIRHNRFRYSAFGREANRTLRYLPIPEISEFPNWVDEINVDMYDSASKVEDELNNTPDLSTNNWREFKLTQFFNMKAGKYIDKLNYGHGNTPYISASDNNNGLMGKINVNPVFRGESLTIGKVGATTYYQPSDFCATSDVTILEPLFEMNKYIGLFLTTVINLEKFKWSYGRQIRLNDCRNLSIKLPVTSEGGPNFDFMEKYIKTLPYSSQI